MHVFSTLVSLSVASMALAGPVAQRSSPLGRRGGKAPVYYNSQGTGAFGTASFDDDDKFLVILQETDFMTEGVDETVQHYAGKASSSFNGTVEGFSGRLDSVAIEKLRNSNRVAFIEQDSKFTPAKVTKQEDAVWGLSRLSHRKNEHRPNYVYDDRAGEGTCIYVIDSGVNVKHPDFEGRAEWAKDMTGDGETDDEGHGTMVAGCAASKTYGVAKKAKILAVRVIDKSGQSTGSSIIGALDFVMGDREKRNCPNGVVVNMSLGGAKMHSLNQAAEKLSRSGIFVAVAAGNQDTDAAETSPASAGGSVCTVGASDENDRRADFSNFGPAVDIFAPGQNIISTSANLKTDTENGTSFASPYIAGLGAYVLSLNGVGGHDNAAGNNNATVPVTPENMCDHIKQLATKGVVRGSPKGTTHALAFNGAEA